MSLPSEEGEVLRSPPPLSQDLEGFENAVRDAVSAGQLLTAIDIARDGLRRFGDSVPLKQQLALALAQTGALAAAREVLDDLRQGAVSDEETLCLFGRVQKELWRQEPTSAQGTEALQQACVAYTEAFAKNEAYYPGINLAYTLAAMGEAKKADECARKVAKQCKAEIAKAGGETNGWLSATLAEALTHQGATAEAAKYYAQAVKLFPGRWRDLASMRRQAREIIAFNPETRSTANAGWRGMLSFRKGDETPGAWLEECFEFPSVVVFSGHMVDAVGRPGPRFPAGDEAKVKEQIRAELVRLRPGFGYSSAACGGDIIFCECLLEMGAKVNLVLPCPVDAFRRQSVSIAGPDWERRFHHVLGNSNTCLIANSSAYATTDADVASSMALVYANRIVTGLAILQAQSLDVELHALALWDGAPGDGAGGTSSVVAEWEARSIKPKLITIGTQTSAVAPPVAREIPPPPKIPTVPQQIKAMVFAEVANYKKVTEAQMSAYVHEFKGAVAQLLASSSAAPLAAESWGGTNYFVYDGLMDASRFALDLRDMMAVTKWAERGLPGDLGVRIVLHAGPVFSFVDPVSKRPAFVGSHVVRAAQVSPVLPPNQVHATQEFAALCGHAGVAGLHFAFMGRLPMTRLFEDAPLYRLDRRHERLAGG